MKPVLYDPNTLIICPKCREYNSTQLTEYQFNLARRCCRICNGVLKYNKRG